MQQKTNKQIQKVKYLKHTGKIFMGAICGHLLLYIVWNVLQMCEAILRFISGCS